MITVVIAALNEEKNLPLTLENVVRSAESVGKVDLDVIIVDDGSRDGTSLVIDEYQKRYSFIRSIRFEENRGIGSGFLEALKIAKGEKLITIPGENACSSYILETVFRNYKVADFLVSYIVNTEERGYWRACISGLYSLIYLVVFHLPIKYINGATVYPVRLLRTLDLRAARYSIFAEASTKALRSGVKFIEIPDYIKPNQTKTAALKFKNFVEVVRVFFRLVREIYFTHRKRYACRPRRLLPEDLKLDLL